jgi:Uncharacterized conserved protein
MDSPPNRQKLVSACLTGINCTFRGKNNLNNKIERLAVDGQWLALCPEVLALLGTPRDRIELSGGDGNDVLDGKARALNSRGKDVSATLIAGARKILNEVTRYGIKEAILKSNSPACGAGRIYDGTFSNTLKDGDGVLTALLKRNGIKVITEKEAYYGE